MSALSGATRSKLVKVLGRLASNHDGERAAAGLLATRIVSCAGLDWNDLLQPASVAQPGAARQGRSNSEAAGRPNVTFCLHYFDNLTDWEKSFVRSVAGRRTISSRQCVILQQAVDSLRARGFA